MSADDVLEELLAGNERHVESVPTDHFAAVQDGQRPAVVSICCSDSRVAQVGMWDADEPGTVFTPSNIGNQVRTEVDGDPVVDGGMLYPIHHAGTEVAAVVGHTGCGAVTAAYGVATGGDLPGPRGVDEQVERLVPVVEAGLESDLVDADAPDERVIDQLVEYNVDEQVAFLRESPDVPESVDVYGFVYDFQGAYGDEHGRAYLVNANGETEPERLAALVPAGAEDAVGSLLY